MRKHWKGLAAALACLLALAGLWVAPGRADVGVRPLLPGGSNIEPQEETPVQMRAEKVVLSVRPATAADNTVVTLNPEAYGLQFQPTWFSMVADVQADFTMMNPTGEAVSMTAWFPLASALETVDWELNPDEIPPSIQNFQVTVDQRPVEVAVSELPNPKGTDKPPLPWASFPAVFPAGAETHIQVRYTVPLQQAVKGKELALYYIFQTGAGWAGPIGQAELVVNLPYPASEATLAMASPGSLRPPYGWADTLPAIPEGVVLDGNQARWMWKDLEPGPQDDFAAWLLDISEWQALDAAVVKAQAMPEDGQAWLELAGIYRSLATSGYNSPSIFSGSYLQPGIDAYRKAAELLPEHPAPHAGLALLTLAPFMKDKNAPPEVMQTVLDEMRIARELESNIPALAEEAGVSSWMVEDILSIYGYNEATATAEWVAASTDWAKETESANITLTPPSPTATPTMLATQTPQPTDAEKLAETAVPQLTPTPQGGLSTMRIGVLLAGLLAVVVVVFVVLRRR